MQSIPSPSMACLVNRQLCGTDRQRKVGTPSVIILQMRDGMSCSSLNSPLLAGCTCWEPQATRVWYKRDTCFADTQERDPSKKISHLLGSTIPFWHPRWNNVLMLQHLHIDTCKIGPTMIKRQSQDWNAWWLTKTTFSSDSLLQMYHNSVPAA